MKTGLIRFFIIFICIVISSSYLIAGDPIQIGTSNLIWATEGSSGRKIIRTSTDDLAVVYQDEINGQKIIQITYSTDRVHWSDPVIIGEGMEPAFAISKDDHIYLAWISGDRKQLKYTSISLGEAFSNPYIISASKNHEFRTPSLEATEHFLHIVWEDNYYIHYQRTNLDFSNLDIQIQNVRIGTGRDPVIAADLEFDRGPIHIFWGGYSMMNFHFLETEDIDSLLVNRPPIDLGIDIYQVSVSVRSWLVQPNIWAQKYASYIVFAGQETTGMIWHWDSTFRIQLAKNEELDIMNPSVDDIYTYSRSCAIIWEDWRGIWYGQSQDEKILDESIVLLSDPIKNAFYASVCYKTFRSDIFDVIWTQGYKAPYKIMFKRHPKDYSSLDYEKEFEFESARLDTGYYKQLYSDYICTSPGWNKMTYKILYEDLPDSIKHREYFGGMFIEGDPHQSGTFNITIRAYAYDSIDCLEGSKTATFTITIINNPPEITSPNSITSENGHVRYNATATDPEENKIEFIFENYPDWLIPDSTFISGTPPTDAQSTTFTLIATDGEMADTLEVAVQTNSNAAVQTENKIPKSFALLPNYPNPFNPSTHIRYTVPHTAHVNLSVYDINGKKVAELWNGQKQTGYHDIEWQTSQFPSGTYLIRMEAGSFKQVRKCLLLR